MPSLEHTVVLPYLDPDPDLSPLATRTAWADSRRRRRRRAQFERVPFDHPLWVLYSSGTTGLPKAIVQGQGGILLEHLKKLHLHVDLHPGDRLFWFTTTGWMMWNFLVSGLLTRAAIVLYDGNPGHPDMGVLWDLAERAGVTCFGTSASYVAACMKAGRRARPPAATSARLRAVGSTGSPLSPEGFDWIYEHVGADTWLFSTSGGTDLCTAFVGGVATLPVYRGELQARALGAAVEAWDEDGNCRRSTRSASSWSPSRCPRCRSSSGATRTAAATAPATSSTTPGVWRHGDWIEITSRGTAVIYGRSDSTINRQGVRMGTQRDLPRGPGRRPRSSTRSSSTSRAPEPRAGCRSSSSSARAPSSTTSCVAEIKRRIREQCSPRHVPDEIFADRRGPAHPERQGPRGPGEADPHRHPAERAASRDSLANPASLDYFADLAERLAA